MADVMTTVLVAGLAAAVMTTVPLAGLAAAQQDYIIRVRRDVDQLGRPEHDILNEALDRCGAVATRRYNTVFVGAAATLTPEQHTCLSSEPGLEIEPVGEATISESWSIDQLDGTIDTILPPPPPPSLTCETLLATGTNLRDGGKWCVSLKTAEECGTLNFVPTSGAFKQCAFRNGRCLAKFGELTCPFPPPPSPTPVARTIGRTAHARDSARQGQEPSRKG
jgi:hypothetical protein